VTGWKEGWIMITTMMMVVGPEETIKYRIIEVDLVVSVVCFS